MNWALLVAASSSGPSAATILLSAVIGGLAGGFGGYVTARTTTKSQEQIARAAREHERLLAGDTRNQERWAATYVDLIDFLNRWNETAHLTARSYKTDPPTPLPELPSDDEQFRLQARVDAYAGERVRELMGEWLQIRSDLQRVTMTISIKRKAPIPQDVTQDSIELGQVVDKLADAADAIKGGARNDLHGPNAS